jgi:hypothetical protein
VHHFDHLPMSEPRSPLSYSLLELFEAIKAKLTAQAECVCWRDSCDATGTAAERKWSQFYNHFAGRRSRQICCRALAQAAVHSKGTIDRGKVESAFRIRLLVLSLPRRSCRRLYGTQIGS